MSGLLIILDTQLHLIRQERLPNEGFLVANCRFQRRPGLEEDVVFYDFLLDEQGCVVALELHIGTEDKVHDFLNGYIPLSSLKYVEYDPFPRIWLSDSREGTPVGLEAFGDIMYFNNDQGVRAIGVDPNAWLGNSNRSHPGSQNGLSTADPTY